jgi:hypothetical protein
MIGPSHHRRRGRPRYKVLRGIVAPASLRAMVPCFDFLPQSQMLLEAEVSNPMRLPRYLQRFSTGKAAKHAKIAAKNLVIRPNSGDVWIEVLMGWPDSDFVMALASLAALAVQLTVAASTAILGPPPTIPSNGGTTDAGTWPTRCVLRWLWMPQTTPVATSHNRRSTDPYKQPGGSG